jgi:hypothetical protein
MAAAASSAEAKLCDSLSMYDSTETAARVPPGATLKKRRLRMAETVSGVSSHASRQALAQR